MRLLLTVRLSATDTFGGLEDLVEFLRQRGNPEFRPEGMSVVATFDVEPSEELLPLLGMEGNAHAALALGAKELMDELSDELRAMGYPTHGWERG
jgi:hypothetical protein